MEEEGQIKKIFYYVLGHLRRLLPQLQVFRIQDVQGNRAEVIVTLSAHGVNIRNTAISTDLLKTCSPSAPITQRAQYLDALLTYRNT